MRTRSLSGSSRKAATEGVPSANGRRASQSGRGSAAITAARTRVRAHSRPLVVAHVARSHSSTSSSPRSSLETASAVRSLMAVRSVGVALSAVRCFDVDGAKKLIPEHTRARKSELVHVHGAPHASRDHRMQRREAAAEPRVATHRLQDVPHVIGHDRLPVRAEVAHERRGEVVVLPRELHGRQVPPSRVLRDRHAARDGAVRTDQSPLLRLLHTAGPRRPLHRKILGGSDPPGFSFHRRDRFTRPQQNQRSGVDSTRVRVDRRATQRRRPHLAWSAAPQAERGRRRSNGQNSMSAWQSARGGVRSLCPKCPFLAPVLQTPKESKNYFFRSTILCKSGATFGHLDKPRPPWRQKMGSVGVNNTGGVNESGGVRSLCPKCPFLAPLFKTPKGIGWTYRSARRGHSNNGGRTAHGTAGPARRTPHVPRYNRCAIEARRAEGVTSRMIGTSRGV